MVPQPATAMRPVFLGLPHMRDRRHGSATKRVLEHKKDVELKKRKAVAAALLVAGGLIAATLAIIPTLSLAVDAIVGDHSVPRGEGHRLGRKRGSIWAHPRGLDMYAEMARWERYSPRFCDKKYYSKFRMTKSTFDYVFNCIANEPEVKPSDEYVRTPVPARKRFAMTMHFLARAPIQDDGAELWGVAQSTYSKIIRQTMIAMDRVLPQEFISFPTEQTQIKSTIRDFAALVGMPQCCGAMDGTFIPILQPTSGFYSRWWSYKHNNYAQLLLAVVDAKGKFLFIDVEAPATVVIAVLSVRASCISSCNLAISSRFPWPNA